MRDSVITFGIFGILIGGFIGLRNHQVNSKTKIASPAKSSSQHTVSKNNQNILGESQHESSNYRRHEQNWSSESRTRTSGEVAEVDHLPHLYEAEESELGLSVEEGSDELAASEQLSEAPVIAGVPVAAWVRSHKNTLKDAVVSGPAPNGLRLFLGCMELKKQGTRSAEKENCEKLLARDSKLANERERY
ncbi:MAG: hypothetical protein EB078_11440 [Proteobacteria bacterium]|nr:hypothetical protein [Pseudomonadota bacterium]